jgi:predicted transcriptional regulator
VRSGNKDFISKQDPALQATYLDAFDALVDKGFIRHEGGHLYKLTGKGFAVARGLN